MTKKELDKYIKEIWKVKNKVLANLRMSNFENGFNTTGAFYDDFLVKRLTSKQVFSSGYCKKIAGGLQLFLKIKSRTIKDICHTIDTIRNNRISNRINNNKKKIIIKKQNYTKMAGVFYSSKKSPKFGKQIINNIVYGQGQEETKGFGWKMVILNRTVGVKIFVEKGRASLGFSNSW